MGSKESPIQKLILQWLQVNKYLCWRNYVGPVIHRDGHFSKNPSAGLPDIMGVLKDGSGKLFAIEVKSKTGRVSPHQTERINALLNEGALAFVARDLETVIKAFKSLEGAVNVPNERRHELH